MRTHGERSLGAVVVLALAMLWSAPAAASVMWTFDLPATGLGSVTPPYPTLATMTLSQTAQGVKFVVDPSESSPGFSSQSFIERLDIAYSGSALDPGDFVVNSGPPAEFSFESNPNNMDAGYRADASHIVIDYPSKNDPNRFAPTDVSVFTILGTTISDFMTLATANNKPDPIHAVISVTAYSLPDAKPTPSNWVTAAVPEPAAGLLVWIGLGTLPALRRRPRR